MFSVSSVYEKIIWTFRIDIGSVGIRVVMSIIYLEQFWERKQSFLTPKKTFKWKLYIEVTGAT